MHSSVAGDIHVSKARTINRAMSSRSAGTPWLDKAHAALLDNLDEGDENEETSLFSGKAGKRVTAHSDSFSASRANPESWHRGDRSLLWRI